jgi:hypothetical protein
MGVSNKKPCHFVVNVWVVQFMELGFLITLIQVCVECITCIENCENIMLMCLANVVQDKGVNELDESH